jgi:hypothetical protein
MKMAQKKEPENFELFFYNIIINYASTGKMTPANS